MNANWPLQTPTIKDWLLAAQKQLIEVGIGTAKLDAEIILAHTLQKNRTYLHAHDDEQLEDRIREIANARLDLRLDRVPIAYIIGHKEFYGRRFIVTPAVLIPRPESEAVITSLKSLLPDTVSLLPQEGIKQLVDVGTGSGCLGITAKLEFPEYNVTLLDTSRYALKIAAKNAKDLHADVAALKSNLLTQYPFTADVIIANLPYVDPAWERSPETDHEPEIALFASNHGLGLIYDLLSQATRTLAPGGILVLEADPVQHKDITARARTNGLHLIHSDGYVITLARD